MSSFKDGYLYLVLLEFEIKCVIIYLFIVIIKRYITISNITNSKQQILYVFIKNKIKKKFLVRVNEHTFLFVIFVNKNTSETEQLRIGYECHRLQIAITEIKVIRS